MKRRAVDHLLAGLQRVLVPPARPNPLLVLWRWRYELIFTCAAIFLIMVAHAVAGAIGVLATVLGPPAVVAGWPAARRYAVTRARCMITPHRVRTGCREGRIHNSQGRLPAVLLCEPAPYGEWVLLWLPAGVTADDVRAGRHVLAAACFATEVRIVPDARYSHIVAMEVIRRR